MRLILSAICLWMTVAVGCYSSSTSDESEQASDTVNAMADSDSESSSSDDTDIQTEKPSDTENQSEDDKLFEIYLIEGSSEELQQLIMSEESVASNLETVSLEDTPLISNPDIVSYEWRTHRIHITQEANDRLVDYGLDTSLDTTVPVVVTAARERIYIATFWPIFLSSIPACPAITFFEATAESEPHLWIGYTGNTWQSETVNDSRIYNTLEAAGLLADESD